MNSSHEVLLAQPVVTPIEQLRRKDKEVARALEEKQKIIADIFNIPPEDYETITDLVVGGDNSKDAKDVLLAVMAQADCLARYICEVILRF